MMVFTQSEKLLAVATRGANFKNRYIEAISSAPERRSLPIRGFRGDGDAQASAPDNEQFLDAKSLANAHGYKNVSYEIVKGEDHNPMTDRVLAYFYGRLESDNSW